jgi:hypothetical protein
MGTNELTRKLEFCAAQCNHCYDACRLENDPNMETCMKNDLDCADVCRLTAQIIERNSLNIQLFMNFCVEICTICANECEKHNKDHCQNCAKACRECVEMCQNEHQNSK